MYFGAVQICGERVGTAETKDFCEALDAHKIKMLSLRECGISTKNFKKIADSIAYCQSILHLNLNLCGIHCDDRVDMLAAALNMNRSLSALLLHGNQFGTEGVIKLVRPLIVHPHITCLDVGDCDIGDKGLKYICELLPPDGTKPGLQELVLSGNPRITPRAWEKFSVAVSACSTLRSLYIDFNSIGETAGKMLVVCAAGHNSLNVLDMEACDLNECVGRLLLHLLQRYPTTLSHVLLEENDITEDTKYAIRIALGESESEPSSSDEEGEPGNKSSDCKPKRKKKKTKKADYCSSEETLVVEKKSKHRQASKPRRSNRGEVSPQGSCTVVRSRRPSNCPNRDCKKPSTCEITVKSESDMCNSPRSGSKCVSYKETSDMEETLAKFKICVQEASDCSEDEVLVEKDVCQAKPDSVCSDSQSAATCDQEYVCKDDNEFVHVHGDCNSGAVQVRVRSKSRDVQKCDDVIICDHKPRSKGRKANVKCCRRKSDFQPLTKRQRCQMNNKSRSRSRGFHVKGKGSRSRGSLGMGNMDTWSDEESEKARGRQDDSAAGRGPWCGRGPLRLPKRPLERMSNLGDMYDQEGFSSARSSLAHDTTESPRQSIAQNNSPYTVHSPRQSVGASPRPSLDPHPPSSPKPSAIPRRLTGALKTNQQMNSPAMDNDISGPKPDSSVKRQSILSKIENVNQQVFNPPAEKKRVSVTTPDQQQMKVNHIQQTDNEISCALDPKSEKGSAGRGSTERNSPDNKRHVSKRSKDRNNATLNNRAERSMSRSNRSSPRSKSRARDSKSRSRSVGEGNRSSSRNRGFLTNLKKFFVGDDVIDSSAGDIARKGRSRRKSMTRGQLPLSPSRGIDLFFEQPASNDLYIYVDYLNLCQPSVPAAHILAYNVLNTSEPESEETSSSCDDTSSAASSMTSNKFKTLKGLPGCKRCDSLSILPAALDTSAHPVAPPTAAPMLKAIAEMDSDPELTTAKDVQNSSVLQLQVDNKALAIEQSKGNTSKSNQLSASQSLMDQMLANEIKGSLSTLRARRVQSMTAIKDLPSNETSDV